MNILGWLDYQLLGNPLRHWSTGVAVFVGALILLFVTRRLLRGRLQKLADDGDRIFFIYERALSVTYLAADRPEVIASKKNRLQPRQRLIQRFQ